MKVVQFSRFGRPDEVAACVEAPGLGAPADDEVVVDIEAFPINPADLLTIEGGYAVKPPLPATPGAECVGRIAAKGVGIRDLAIGDRVVMLARENWAQQRKVKAEQVLKIAGDADVLQLAMLKVNPATALLMLREYVSLRSGEWVIQDAANSGVGHNLIRLAKADGLRTVKVVRRDALVEPLKAVGADAVVVDGPDLAERVAAATGGARIRLAIDAIAGDICIRLGDCLAEGGVLVNYGLLSGKPCMLRADQTVFKDLTLKGFWLAKWLSVMPRERLQTTFDDLAGRVAAGSLQVPVEATYDIADIKAALAHAAREGRSGKILVTPNGPVA